MESVGFVFFFQAEDGIRDADVTGVQTCALPIFSEDFGGLEVVVDCANGAAAEVAPEAYRRAGASVTTIGASPDGHNINDGCGSTHPDHVGEAVVRAGAASC